MFPTGWKFWTFPRPKSKPHRLEARLRAVEQAISVLRYEMEAIKVGYEYQSARATESENRASEARHAANKLVAIIGQYEERFKRLESAGKKKR